LLKRAKVFFDVRISAVAVFALMLLTLFVLSACSSSAKRPVFYPNSYMKQVGQGQAQRDADECMALADSYSVSRTKDGEVATKATSGALIGGVGAGAWGIVRGDAGERALAGALAGGSAGAVKGGVDSTRLSPTFQRFVNQCLQERGYQVIGWE
jgi:uncharacterized membrane protein